MNHRILRTVLGLALALFASGASFAQGFNGGGTQSFEAFALGGNPGQLAVTTTSARIALTAGHIAWVCNIGASVAFVALGNNTVVATTAGMPIPNGMCVRLGISKATTGMATIPTNIAAITAAGTTTLSIATGVGSP